MIENPKTLILTYTTDHMYRISSIEKKFGIKWEDVEDWQYTNKGLELQVDGVWKSADIEPDLIYGDDSIPDDIFVVAEELDDNYAGWE